MSLSKTVFLPLAFLLLAIGAVLVWNDGRIGDADQRTCAVYQAFFEQLSDKKAVFVNSTSKAYAYFPSEYVSQPPRLFERSTAEQQIVSFGPDMPSYTVPVREFFEHDTAPFFDPVVNAKPQNITECFQGQGQAPGIFDGPFNLLYTREKALGRTNEGFVTLWSLSPVGFSDDSQFAIMYFENYCGGLCGWGGFMLMENRNSNWIIAGDKWIWVS